MDIAYKQEIKGINLRENCVVGISVGLDYFFKNKALNKVFHANLVGALNVMRIRMKSLKLNFYENLKALFVKLCNPVKFKLIDFLHKISPEPLLTDIWSSRQDKLIIAGWMEKLGRIMQFNANPLKEDTLYWYDFLVISNNH